MPTAQQNGELLDFLALYQRSSLKRGTNLSNTATTDIPKNPGRKGSVPSTSKRSHPKLPIDERVKRAYPQNHSESFPTAGPFCLKKMHSRIKVCQRCRGSLKSTSGTICSPPFDFCVARKERRPFRDRETGLLRTPSRETDVHYHLCVACIQTQEPSFIPRSLLIPEGLPLTECHQTYLEQEFGFYANEI